MANKKFLSGNHRLGDMRISKDMNDLLNEISKSIGLAKTDIARMLLYKSLKKLKFDIKKAGIENINFEIKSL